MNIAVITGASSGIGREFVKETAKDISFNEIWIIARRENKLLELKAEINNASCGIAMPKIVTLTADITKEPDIGKIKDLLAGNKKNSQFSVKLLVNSAGYGKLGRFKDANTEDSAGMADLNCTALTRLTSVILPYMDKGSRIINMASAAAFMPQPGFAVYAATKAYVLSFSRAIRAELKKQGIKVTAVCPGPVKTEFFDIAEKGGEILKIKKFFMADATEVAKKSLRASRRNKAVYTHKISMKMFRLLVKVLPKSCIMPFIKVK